MEPFVLKYAPKNSKEIVGQNQAVNSIINFLHGFRKGKYCLVQGPVGTGKTSSIYAIAEDAGYDVLEINASDNRNKNAIEELLNNATKQGSIFGNKRIILVDEIDGLSGTKDRGALPTLIKIAKESPTPIIMTLQDATDRKYNTLMKYASVATFVPVNTESIREVLKKICILEKLDFEEDAIRMITSKAGGDLRIAINDLQVLSVSGITKSAALELVGRNREVKIKDALVRVLKTTSASVSLGSFDDVNENLDGIFSWLEYNLPFEYKKLQDLAQAYDSISKADVFNGRIRRWQYYRFYVYCYALLSVGVSISKNEKYSGIPNLKESSRGLMIWMSRNKLARKLSISSKLAEYHHTSSKQAFKMLPHLIPAMKKDSSFLDLSKEEKEWLNKQ